MKKPVGWVSADKALLTGNIKKLDMSEAEIQQLLKNSEGSILLFAFTKYPANKRPGVNPTIQARVISTKLDRPLTFEEFKPAIVHALTTQLKVFDQHEFVVEPTEITVGNVKGVYAVSTYLLGTQAGQKYRIRSKSYAIPYRNYYFKLNIVDDADGPDHSLEYDDLIESIKIGK